MRRARNGESATPGALETVPATSRALDDTTATSAIVTALEALEDGDGDYAVTVLLGALEDGPEERRHACHLCPMRFEWPGLLSHHLQLGHGVDPG